MKNIYNIIYAVNKDNIFSINGRLPWNCKSDMENFKKLTNGNIVIMGRLTFESLPFKNGLPNRLNIIITSENKKNILNFRNIKDCVEYIELNYENKKIFFIGGTKIIEEVYENYKYLLSNIYKSVIKENCMVENIGDKIFFDLKIKENYILKDYDDFYLYQYIF